MHVPAESSATNGVALVILNYNYRCFLADALDSALAQSQPYEQILVVDDGSTDGSRALLERYRGRVELLYKPNGGQLSAARAALRHVRCKYIHFLDSDDYVVPNARELIGDHMSGNPVKIQFRLQCVNQGAMLHSILPSYPDSYDSAAMQRDNQLLGMAICPPTSGNVFRTDVLRRLQLQRLNERDYIDGTPNLAMPYCGVVTSVDQVIASYRLHDRNVSQHQVPTKQRLQDEIDRLHRRWRELPTVLPGVTGPTPGSPLLELEALIMIAAMDGRRELQLQRAYLTTLLQSGMPARKKLLLSLWAIAVAAAPTSKLAHQLVRTRRSAVNRSQHVRRLISLCLGNAAA